MWRPKVGEDGVDGILGITTIIERENVEENSADEEMAGVKVEEALEEVQGGKASRI